jgi:hypothetical protein
MSSVVRSEVLEALNRAEARGEKRVRVIVSLRSVESLQAVRRAIDRTGAKTTASDLQGSVVATLSRQEVLELGALTEDIAGISLDPAHRDSAPSGVASRVRCLLRDELWNGVRGIASLLTLTVTIFLSWLVYQWDAGQDQSHLTIQALTCSRSEDYTQWRVQAVVDNNGPRTASDLTIEVAIAADTGAKLEGVSILHDGYRYGIAEPHRQSSVLWYVVDPPAPFAARDLQLDHYRQHLARLLVGDYLVVSAQFTTDPLLGQGIAAALEEGKGAPSTNPHGAGEDSEEHLRQQYSMLTLRGYFIQDISVSADLVVANKSSLWRPLAARARSRRGRHDAPLESGTNHTRRRVERPLPGRGSWREAGARDHRPAQSKEFGYGEAGPCPHGRQNSGPRVAELCGRRSHSGGDTTGQ